MTPTPADLLVLNSRQCVWIDKHGRAGYSGFESEEAAWEAVAMVAARSAAVVDFACLWQAVVKRRKEEAA